MSHETLMEFLWLCECFDWDGCCVFQFHVLFLFFFFTFALTVILYRTKIVIHALFITVYALKNIKNGSHGIIIHLKIILLQYFQFSVSTTINSIQTDPICLKSQNVRPVKWEPTRNKILLFSFFYIYINNPMKNIR